LAIALTTVNLVPNAAADPNDNWSDIFWRGDLDGTINAVASYGGQLVVGGEIYAFGLTGVGSNVACSDGHAWSELGSGVTGTVLCLQVYGQELYCGGLVDLGGSTQAFLKVLSGTQWTNVGAPLAGASVEDMHVVDGELIVAGALSQVAGQAVSNVAAFDGNGWRALGTGLLDRVTCLTSDSGMLFAGGEFTAFWGSVTDYIAQWTGANWASVGASLGEAPNAIAWHGGELYAGTGYLQSCDPGASAPLRKLVGPVWEDVGGGLFDDRTDCCPAGSDPCANGVRDLLVAGDKLIVGGHFTQAGSGPGALSAGYVVAWNGANWESLDGGIVGYATLLPFNRVEVLGLHRGSVVAGGDFQSAGGVPAVSAALWAQDHWLAPVDSGEGIHSRVRSLCEFDGDLFATGEFNLVGSVGTRGIARWDGSGWHAVGGEIDGDGLGTALVEYGDELILGGTFQSVGGVAADNIARWDGNTWSPLGTGQAVDNGVAALAVMEGNLIVGGTFTSAGGVPANRIALWDGVNWHPLGTGFDDGGVTALVAFQDDLIAGGSFTYAGGSLRQYIARWDGIGWQSMGVANCPVAALIAEGTSLYAGGCFTYIGGTSVYGVGRWDGVRWHDMDGGFYDTLWGFAFVKSMTFYEGRLVVGGAFDRSWGGQWVNRIAFWNGTQWMPFGSGLTGLGAMMHGATALGVWDGDLYVGGDFEYAGLKACWDIARWRSETTPVESANGPSPAGSSFLELMPNPANPQTVIRFELQARAPVRLDIHDARGQLVRRLLGEERDAGQHSVTWDGQDLRDRPVATGVYLVRLRTGREVRLEKLSLVR